MAAALFLLALARVPALVRNGKDTVFLAAVFEGLSTVLIDPAIYTAIDPLIGGFNLTKVAGSTFMVLGLWFLRKAVLHAISPDAEARNPLAARLPLITALALQLVFFALTGPVPSTPAWGSLHHTHPPAVLFSLVVIGFVGWSCAEIARACLRFIPGMRSAFRVGFAMVLLGCLISVAVTVFMALEVIRDVGWFPILGPASSTAPPFAAMELAAIVLVGIGLTIPAQAGRRDRKRAEARVRANLAKVEPIREQVLADTGTARALETDTAATPPERLHRMIVEIWDADLAAGTGPSVLTSEERTYLLSVETDLNLELR